MKIATWNVNSVRARLDNITAWLTERVPDVVFLQEIKCQTEDFPEHVFTELGYTSLVWGQKAYNGVAILSRLPISHVCSGLPGDDTDQQARYIEADINGKVRVASLYLPNGNPAPGDKYAYKLQWMDRLYKRAESLLGLGCPVVLGGDYNICPTDDDVYAPEKWAEDALCRPESRARFRSLLHLGYRDAFRVINREPHRYTFWDYQAGAWPKDHGLRIDHFLLSPQATDSLLSVDIDRAPRGREKASDHTPVMCEFGFGNHEL
ncbi:exodeoxyribonuclease III [Haematospirillum jordaniae]|uniref:Exodeoxyribonuclease III n=1 Tax=Haematospirillum jordaniae TaxID=1549855 RepID=A0A143DEW2_9PROT|nr:exodeoxyribonuclease III [Haematospirillum jordaniae]AMW35206.1 exodeoxyribonuclease III [Haematospirillum jordaniae]NKD45642.1 exodeoxyribonuclease III [Haematospirillum jordaniae]NKD56395.1 exodeoxyribonuclease III [Haematospirillum jordaniae]NKD58453.1 exodeoxyribonuclease III [Haematospirillum jordaniae]NKD66378.1 exodeoxyribonuclease III [Haematospirillum jordaniae]